MVKKSFLIKSHSMKLNIIILLVATISTGLMAGLFFIWTNTIKPGIGKLSDPVYLESFQSMNKVILNPTFLALFMGSMLFLIMSTVLNYNNSSIVFKLILLSTLIYFFGTFLMTIVGNVPLNNLLEKTDLSTLSLENAKQLRSAIENKWNSFNLIRTITSSISFALLLIALIKIK